MNIPEMIILIDYMEIGPINGVLLKADLPPFKKA